LSTATSSLASEKAIRDRRRSFILVTLCTFLGAAAQVLIKSGASSVHAQGLLPTLLAMLFNFKLVFGYSLYGLSTALMVVALRYGELSILYPIIALTYVWVSVLSVVLFNEQISLLKACGIGVIVAGVAVLGKGSKS
jgi:drug/metabolite transporter (DMT)-like permease